MNERERSVCARVRIIREDLKWSQIDFAREVGITRPRLASIEYAHTPLRYDLAAKIAYVFGVSLKWMASGIGPMRPYTPMLWTVEQREHLKGKSLLSHAYDYAPGLFEPLKQSRKLRHYEVPRDFDYRAVLFDRILWQVRALKFKDAASALSFVHDANRQITMTVLDFVSKGLATNSDEKHRAVFIARKSLLRDLFLTGIHASVKQSEVKAQWPLLKQRLQKATSESGAKSKLAEFLGVKLASVSQWLTDSDNAREPGAETALRMLYWVERREHK